MTFDHLRPDRFVPMNDDVRSSTSGGLIRYARRYVTLLLRTQPQAPNSSSGYEDVVNLIGTGKCCGVGAAWKNTVGKLSSQCWTASIVIM